MPGVTAILYRRDSTLQTMHTLISAPKPDRDSSACSPPGRTCSAAPPSSLSRRPCHDQKAGCKPSAQTSASIMMIASQPFLDAFGDATAHNGYSARGVHPGWHPVDARGIGDLSLYLRPFGDPSESPKVARHGYAEEGRHPTDRSRSDHRMAAGWLSKRDRRLSRVFGRTVVA